METNKTEKESVLNNKELNHLLTTVVRYEKVDNGKFNEITLKQIIDLINSMNFIVDDVVIESLAICKKYYNNYITNNYIIIYGRLDYAMEQSIMEIVPTKVGKYNTPISEDIFEIYQFDKSNPFRHLQSLSIDECIKFNKISTNTKILATFKNDGEINMFFNTNDNNNYFNRAFINKRL